MNALSNESEMIEKIKEEMNNEFRNHMIPFWKSMIDEEKGGYYGLLDSNLHLDKNGEKGCILNSRIMWFFSNAYISLKDESMLEYAKCSYEFFEKAFLDKEEGGVYWSVTSDGKPLDETKHTYCQAFQIYGLSSYYDASKDEKALDYAYQLFKLIEDRCRDKGGYLEAFDRRFVPASNEKLSENGVMATRTMNTLLHVMEAYTELYRVLGEDGRADEVRAKLTEILEIFRSKVFDSTKQRLEVFFDKEYNSLLNLHSFGHDIEAAWLIDRTVDVLNYKGTEHDMSDITDILTNKIYECAYDGTSVPAESENGKVLCDRIWWVECESVIGFINGYNKDKKRVDYLNAAYNVW
ncbi:MAG: AGE family epimerase/isomerase, partial [Eubacterium sp.]|nr:AGE family epimerase/isomerase [Eubacterium sp.]